MDELIGLLEALDHQDAAGVQRIVALVAAPAKRPGDEIAAA
jgi:hypothetical protein